MIILDTNVISEFMESPMDLTVVAWLDRQPRTSLWTTAINVFEIRWGLDSMPPGARQAALSDAFNLWLKSYLKGRVFDFDMKASKKAARLMANCERDGRPMDFRDGMVAGVALVRRTVLATRNVKHFSGTGLDVVDPWTAHD